MNLQEFQAWARVHLFRSNGWPNSRASVANWWLQNGFGAELACFEQLASKLAHLSFSSKLKRIMGGTLDVPQCPVCGSAVPIDVHGKPRKFCSYKCINLGRSEENRKQIGQSVRTAWAKSHETVTERRESTCLMKFGCKSTSHRHLTAAAIELLHDKAWLTDQHLVQHKPFCQIAQELGVHERSVHRVAKCIGLQNKLFAHSQNEIRLASDLRSLGLTVMERDRTLIAPYELDIVIPEHKVAIEVCGVYFHSYAQNETATQRQYHLRKWQRCQTIGYKLFTVFDNEGYAVWLDVISSHLVPQLTIGARSCTHCMVPAAQANEFYAAHHLLGAPSGASVHLGLEHHAELVGIMSFVSVSGKWLLTRFCTKPAYRVMGGASKLFQKFINTYHPSQVTTYADRRYSNGQVYEKMGFRLIGESAPRYYYCEHTKDGWKLLNRRSFQKHLLSKKLNDFDPNLSESQNMFANGYRRIWDCGHLCFVWTAP